MHDLGVRILIIEGGEPFLWRDGAYSLADVVDEAKKLFFSVGVAVQMVFAYLDLDKMMYDGQIRTGAPWAAVMRAGRELS